MHWGVGGKIAQTLAFLTKYEDAVRRDLMIAGLSFDSVMEDEDSPVSWSDLYAFCKAAPPGSAISHAVNEGWTLSDHLLATILDRWNTWIWWHSKDGQAKPPRNRPDRIPRPGVEERKGNNVLKVGGMAARVMSPKDFLARMRGKGGKKD